MISPAGKNRSSQQSEWQQKIYWTAFFTEVRHRTKADGNDTRYQTITDVKEPAFFSLASPTRERLIFIDNTAKCLFVKQSDV